MNRLVRLAIFYSILAVVTVYLNPFLKKKMILNFEYFSLDHKIEQVESKQHTA